MWKKLVCGVLVAVAVVLFTMPAPALAGSTRYPRPSGSGHVPQHYYRPPVRYYAPAVRYSAPRYYAAPRYSPGVNVRFAVPFPFFSFYLW